MICGIDPGLIGGIAFVANDTVLAYRTPVLKVSKKRYIDIWSAMTMIKNHKPSHIFIEKQQAMPRQGLSSTFQTGFGYGVYIGMIVALGIPYSEVSPRLWKRDYGLSSDKDESRQRATELMPDGQKFWSLKCEDGVAEAALIARWGATKD